MAGVQTRQGRWAWRIVLGGAGTAVLLGLAACGQEPASSAAGAGSPAGTPSPAASPSAAGAASSGSPLQGSVPVGAGPALCAGLSQLTSLTVTRVVSLPNHLHFPFPPVVKISDPAQVRAVAAAACPLPQLPRVMMTCPADLGVSYRLAFAAPGRGYPVLTAAAGGCAKLVGLDVTRQAVPGFWVLLGRAIGLPAAARAAFGGTPG